jgi:hypothetical protein
MRLMTRLPPATTDLLDDAAHPYFLWWSDVTVGELKRLLRSPDIEERAYGTGALLREANTRDVWQFVQPADIRSLWPVLLRHLGRSRAMWGWLLGLDASWPPASARTAVRA